MEDQVKKKLEPSALRVSVEEAAYYAVFEPGTDVKLREARSAVEEAGFTYLRAEALVAGRLVYDAGDNETVWAVGEKGSRHRVIFGEGSRPELGVQPMLVKGEVVLPKAQLKGDPVLPEGMRYVMSGMVTKGVLRELIAGSPILPDLRR